jgi:P-type Cu2+ transporter
MNATTLTLADTPAAQSLAALDDPLEWDAFTRWTSTPRGRVGESALQLTGLHCAACAGIIEQLLMSLAGVQAVQVNAAAQRASVRWDPQHTRPAAWVAALRRQGYDAAPDVAASTREMRQREQTQALWRLFVAAFCAMQVMMFAAPAYFAEAGDLSAEMRRLLNWGSWVLTLPVVMFSAQPFFTGAWRAMRQRRIGMDVPVALAIAIMLGAGTAATFDPGGVFGHEVYFDSLTMFVALLLCARWFEMRVRHSSATALEGALARLPDVALRQEDGRWCEVSVRRLRPGDVLRVPVGAAFAADGQLTLGATVVDEALLTGESMPVAKAVGSEVVAGTLNRGAPVEMRVQRCGADTRLHGIHELMRQAQSERPDAARLADRWAGPFLWAVLALSALAGGVWHVLRPDTSHALTAAVAVLIVTCPCALSLAAPTTLLAAARALARRGVIVQRLASLEALARADHVVFDKTGTLTQGRPTLAAVHGGSTDIGPQEGAALAASLAQWSSHPLSQALVVGATRAAGPSWRDVQELPGLGLSASDAQGQCWRLGSAAFVGVPHQGTDAPGAVWLTRGDDIVASFSFNDPLREDAQACVLTLQARGIKVALLSGDQAPRVAALAAQLHIAQPVAAATPAQKLAYVAALQASGHTVVMVGDGINDAPVLARADVALAMGQGALVSRVQADAVIVSNRLADIDHAQTIARRAMQLVRQNMVWAVAYNGACIPLALLGWLPPWLAGLGMALSSLVVVGNALRVEPRARLTGN